MSAPALELVAVRRDYPGGVTALADVSIRIQPSELVAIVGRSGSGKSTLLNIMGTLDLPSNGSVLVGGTDTRTLNDRQLSALRGDTIGFVFQSFHLTDGLTAEQNVMTALLYGGTPRRRRAELAREALHRVGLGARLEHRAQQLSGGEKQRVAIARAIVTDPLLVLADEPTGALDTTNGEHIMGLLETLNSQGTTVVVITHDGQIADRLPRRIELRDGHLVSDSSQAAAHV